MAIIVVFWLISLTVANGEGETVETPIGKVPAPTAINIEGLQDMDAAKMVKVLTVNRDEWKDEVVLIEEHYARFGTHLPKELADELANMKKNLA